ncbi:aromatic prenyltransferase [Apodospora peruviana]|uniref:Aromatic prenyltransferase n=1 Tax=Apodospora peruviana TaxID=516989 RepID=A0AAE0HX38_9PEZI|nr:aromatic prenyltransferase [Apodospora peruviana]
MAFRSKDQQFWWDTTGSLFARLLQAAGYNTDAVWPSNWAPGGTPVESSWDFGVVGGDGAMSSMVRYTFEPIGRHPGTPHDPLNDLAADEWIHRRRPLRAAPAWLWTSIDPVVPSSNVYLYPGLRVLELDISNLDVVERALRSLPPDEFEALHTEPLLEYLREATLKWEMETGIIYVRAPPNTTLAWLMDAITLGGRTDLEEYKESVQDLKELWKIFPGNPSPVVPADAPGRAKPGFYFTRGRGKPTSAKMYFSPGYFVKNDLEVIAKLRRFFASRRRKTNMDVVDSYARALHDIYGQELLEKPGWGALFYVGAAMTKNEGLRVVAYQGPQIIGARRQELGYGWMRNDGTRHFESLS